MEKVQECIDRGIEVGQIMTNEQIDQTFAEEKFKQSATMKTVILDGVEYSITHDRETGDTILEGQFQDLLIKDLYRKMRDDSEYEYMTALDDNGNHLLRTNQGMKDCVDEFVNDKEVEYVNAHYLKATVLKHN